MLPAKDQCWNTPTALALSGMGQIIALADFRKEKLKAKLFKFADNQKPAIVETETTTISAMRIFCRDLFVVLIDKFGYQNSVNYSEITDVSPMLPVADMVKQAGWQVTEAEPEETSNVVVSFRQPLARS
jgi:hypothetical protein